MPGTVTGGLPDNLTLASAVHERERTSRPIYRHSVIPGGVYSFEELVEATAADPVVYERYGSAARNTSVRVVASPGPRRVYMSYRIGDRIYWTRTKMRLDAGETTLTNGEIEIRARCGNQIAETEMFPVADSEPDAREFDSLVGDEPDLLASTAPPVGIASVPSGLQSVTPPVITGAVPTVPIGVPGGGSGTFAAGVPRTNPILVGAPPLVGPPGGIGFPPLPFPIDTPLPGGPPDGDRPDWTTPPLQPPDPPFVPDDVLPKPDDEAPTLTPVPEPGTFVLLGSALAGLVGMRLRQRARTSANPPPQG